MKTLVNVRVWIDALTPKQARLAAYLAKRLEDDGARVLITVRRYEYTEYVARVFAKRLGLAAGIESIGVHGGGGLKSKLEADLQRASSLLTIVEKFKPDVLISYPSPSALRVAFGLGVPSIVISDTPHSTHAHRLTVPLASAFIHSRLIPSAEFERYVLREFTRVYSYYGFEELEWVKLFEPQEDEVRALGVEPGEYFVFRVPEVKAAYYNNIDVERLLEIVRALCGRGLKLILMPRYEDDVARYTRLLGDCRIEVLEWRRAVDALNLEYHAAAVVTGGATMAREAASLGVPSIYNYPVTLNKTLRCLGLPLYHASEADKFMSAIGTKGLRTRVLDVLNRMEPPSVVVKKAIVDILWQYS